MTKFRFLCLMIVSLLFTATPLLAAEPAQTPIDKTAVEKIIRDVLRDNPEIIIHAIESYRAKRDAEQQKKAREALASRRQEINGGELTPIGGNPKGSVTVVEFFDYQCGYCKRVFPAILELLQSDKTIRYVFKELPILGPESLLASQAALAVWKMDKSKYLPFHTALMSARGRLNEKRLMRIARESGIDPAKLRKRMDDPRINESIQKTLQLAQSLNINGTPAFIIGNRVIPGAVSLEELKKIISEARKS